MTWKMLEIKSWDHFNQVTHDLVNIAKPHELKYYLRGQSNAAWRLVPTLLRLLPEGVQSQQALKVEEALLDQFRSAAHLHLPPASLPSAFPPPALLEWWALMQHHHAPTRILDWTRSPYVAAYFAVERDWEYDGAVFLVHGGAVQAPFVAQFGPGAQVKNDDVLDPSAPHMVFFSVPKKSSDRLLAQQGHFSLSVGILGSHEDVIETACSTAETTHPGKLFSRKIVIAKELKAEFLSRLRIMNIAAHSLFPGVDGLGRSVAEAARLAGS